MNPSSEILRPEPRPRQGIQSITNIRIVRFRFRVSSFFFSDVLVKGTSGAESMPLLQTFKSHESEATSPAKWLYPKPYPQTLQPEALNATPSPLHSLGRPLGYLIFSLMALIRDPIYQYLSKGFRGQPSSETQIFSSSAGMTGMETQMTAMPSNRS